MELLFLEPVFKEAIWGGTKLRDSFGYDIPSDTTGECWAISAHKNGDCKIAGGRYDGRYLSQLWEEEPELFGNYPGSQFPLLIKIIDAKNDLSIQVHPDDAYASEHENGSLGKTECWYVLDCEPGTKIVIGHNAKDKKELEEIDSGFREVSANRKRNMIVMGDKFPFRYLADEYQLDYRAAFSGCSSDTEPSAKTIAYLIDKVKEEQIPAVYYLELSSHRVAEIIGEETGAEPLLLHSCHNVTRAQFDAGITYAGLMRQNIENLRKGID